LRYKKNSIKPKKSHVIANALIQNRNFVEIVSIASRAALLTNRDRYIYGYALLQTQNPAAALVNLWPLVAKGMIKLQEDCAVIATHVFANENLLLSMHLSDDAMQTLLLAGKNLAPQSAGYYALRQRLCDTLWHERQFEQLERILKSNKEDFSGILVENLSKLDFFQPNRKLASNIPAFVGHVLTGGACLVMRDATYHGDITAIIGALANEIKSVFYKLQVSGQKLSWSRAFFEDFVDYEASILIQVLQLAVKNNQFFEIIPTPGYLVHYDATSKRISEEFLAWLKAISPELLAAYNVDTYQAVLWVLGSDKVQYVTVLRLVQDSSDNPYLHLAIMLRAMSAKKIALTEEIASLEDVTKCSKTTNIFKQVAAKTIRSIIRSQVCGSQVRTTLTPIWDPIFASCVALQDSTCEYILSTCNFAKQLVAMGEQKRLCETYVLMFADEKQTSKIIKTIKTEADLRTHLTMLTDCGLLLNQALPKQFFDHIAALTQNKKINKLMKLQYFFDFDPDWHSDYELNMSSYIHELLDIANYLDLPIIKTPDMAQYLQTLAAIKTPTPKLSILVQTDPFKTLGVSIDAAKSVIMQKIMQLMQQSPSQMAAYRQAQSELFHPEMRFLHQYLRYLSYDVETNIEPSLLSANDCLTKIPLRYELLNES